MEQFYFGFCNATIWPLFHYFPSFTIYQSSFWEQYRHVNQIFCDSLMEVLDTNDVVWIHDYHLMLLPSLLKAHRPQLSIGFLDRKSTRLNSSHLGISYAVFCLKKKKIIENSHLDTQRDAALTEP